MSYKRFNPRLLTLIESLEYISGHEPCPMDKIPAVSHFHYKWLWGLRDRVKLIRIERSKKDGRSHIVWLTRKGFKFLEFLKELQKADVIFCRICGVQIKSFFKVSNKRWKSVMGKRENDVVCRKCFEVLESYSEGK